MQKKIQQEQLSLCVLFKFLIFATFLKNFGFILQLFRLNMEGQLGVGERCLDIQGGSIKVTYCKVKPSGPWSWDEVLCIKI